MKMFIINYVINFKYRKSDIELRERINKHPFNGAYAILICRSCEKFWTDPDKDTASLCKIVNKCKECTTIGG